METGRKDSTPALAEARKHLPVIGDIDRKAFTERIFWALDRFGGEFEAGRYIPASLPCLPFFDEVFDLVIDYTSR